MLDPKVVLSKLDEVRAETLRRMDNLTQEQLDWRPPQDGGEAWSLGEVLMHLAIDEFYLRELIARPLLEGIKPIIYLGTWSPLGSLPRPQGA